MKNSNWGYIADEQYEVQDLEYRFEEHESKNNKKKSGKIFLWIIILGILTGSGLYIYDWYTDPPSSYCAKLCKDIEEDNNWYSGPNTYTLERTAYGHLDHISNYDTPFRLRVNVYIKGVNMTSNLSYRDELYIKRSLRERLIKEQSKVIDN